jgi:hypothetical protein
MRHLEFALRLIAQAGLGTPGRDLYIGAIPNDVKNAVMIRGPIAGTQIDEGMANYYDSYFTVVVRDPNPDEGYSKAEAIATVLKVDRVEDENIFVLKMNPSSLPVSYPKGVSDEVETSMRVHIAWGIKN